VWHMGQDIAHKMDFTPLPATSEECLPNSLPKPYMGIGNTEPYILHL